MKHKIKILVTGSAGFIGMHTALYLSEQDYELTGLDSINDYYDKSLKYARLAETGIDCDTIRYGQILKSSKLPSYQFVQLDLTDKEGMNKLFEKEKFDIGRPDISFIFTKAILKGEPLKIFNYGEMMRDFTFIDDIVVGISNSLKTIPVGNPCWKNDSATSSAPFRIYNIGASNPVKLMDFITTLESALGMNAIKEMLPMQPGDVISTYADVSLTQLDLNYKPQVSLKEGLEIFVKWYLNYYQGGTH